MLRKLLLATSSLLITLLVFEVAFRLFDLRGFHEDRTRDWKHALRPDAELLPQVRPMFRPGSEFTFRYDSNPRGYFDADNGLTYRMNRHGFRGADHPMKKLPGVFRIIVIGDSFTFGEGVRLEDTFVARLQAILEQQVSSRIEVLNFGVGAWNTLAEINYLRHEGVRFQPDLVLVVFTPNDTGHSRGLDLWQDFRATYEPPESLRRSYLASAVYANVARILLGRAYIDQLVGDAMAEPGTWKLTLALLRQGKRVARAAGAGYGIVIFPFMYELHEHHPLAPIHALVSNATKSAGIPTVDLLPAFYGESYTDLWVHPSDQHPNERAHAIAAAAIARFLVDEELLPGAAR